MLRSILLSVEFKVTSYTKWAADLKENHLHAILSGFPVGDTPGTGTFYDFRSRLWLSGDDNLSHLFLLHSARDGLFDLLQLSAAGDGTPVYTAAREHRKRTCDCLENGIRNCKCPRSYSQPDCDTGWDSHRGRFYFGYDLYMLTAADSENGLPVFPFLGPASGHDSFGFFYNRFSMKQFLPEANVKKLLLDSAHDAMACYEYCLGNGITPFHPS